MDKLIIFTIIAVTLSFCNCEDKTPSNTRNTIPGLVRSEIRDDSGQYSISFRSESSSQSEQGLLKRNREGTGNVLVKQGSYWYISPEGVPISMNYIADENGFQPFGSHLPQPVSPLTDGFIL